MMMEPKDIEFVELEIQNYRAKFARTIVRYITGTTAIVAVSVGVLWLFFRDFVQLPLCAIVVVLLGTSTRAYSFFQRRGQMTTGILVFLSTFLFLVFACPLLIPETLPLMIICYVFAVILGYLFLGNERGNWLLGICALLLIADAFLVRFVTNDWFPDLEETVGLIIGVFLGPLLFTVLGLIVRMIVLGQQESFRQSQLTNLHIERRIASEQEQQKQLRALVQKCLEYVEAVGQGDLTAQLDFDGAELEGENAALLELGHSLNWTAVSWQIMITQIRDAANSLSAAAAEILAATTQQAAGANEQSTALSQTTTTVDEVKIIAEQAVARAQEVADASQRTVEISRDGQQAVQQTIAGMRRIKERVESIAENILSLSEQTQQIGDIIASVNDLAAQSNMLALNAAVEAARAGEHGKGFAVVASEVRALAEQSKQATTQIKAILEDIQKATNTTVMATEEGTKGVDEGVLLAAQAQDAIAQLAGVIDASSQAATQMVAGGRQQATGVEQIALAMNSINQATVQNLASTHQAEKIAQALSELARSLAEIVEQYRV